VRADGLTRIAPATLTPNAAAWYDKEDPTFSDAIAAVRRVLWCPPDFPMSRQAGDNVIIPGGSLKRLVQTLSSPHETRRVELRVLVLTLANG